MKKFKNNFGFSLVELLIVITIIGVLASIVLNSVSNSRARAYDSKIKQQLSSFRAAAEMYFLNQLPNSYGPGTSSCATNPSLFTDFSPTNGSPGLYIDPANLPTFSQVFCDSTDSAFAVKVTLYSGTDYWCVDSKGASRLVNGTPASGTICP